MQDYDFHYIFEPLEFQDFARDMVQIRDNILFESFVEGKDLGIDGRYVQGNGKTTILQAKRLKKVNVKSLAKEEKHKLDELDKNGVNISRYIIVFSTNLSVYQKEQLLSLMHPYIIHTSDIIGNKDLNNYLMSSDQKYKSIEEKYFKLWIQNTNTLKKVIFNSVNAPMVQISKMNLEKSIEKAKVFVETNVYEKALRQLKVNNILFISGEPGVGKTTLANQLALYYFLKYEYHTYVYATSVDDLYKAQNTEGKKVVVFDDFWGSNFFLGLGNGADEKRLAMIIDYIRNRDDYILILTTREYILEQGLKQNEDLRHMIESFKLECIIEQYSDSDKLKIYYGHLKNSRLTWKQLNALVNIYDHVIESENYNPRVIEMFLNTVETSLDANECAEAFLNYIENPNDFWSKIYENLSEEAQTIYLIMATMPLPVEVKEVAKCYTQRARNQNKALAWKSFEKAIKELEKTVIKTDCFESDKPIYTITFQNPSVKDFIIALITNNPDQYVELLLDTCQCFNQCIELLNILRFIKLENNFYLPIMRKAINKIDSESIIFTDKYRYLLADKENAQKFHSLFQTDEVHQENGYGRIINLLCLYKSDSCFELKHWFETKLEEFMCILDRYPGSFLYEDIIAFPNLAMTYSRLLASAVA